MSIRLRVDPAEIRNAAAEIKSAAASLKRSIAEADEAVMSCTSFWEGEASEKHRTMYAELKEKISEAAAHVEEYPARLLSMAGIYTGAEESAGELAGSLQSDVVNG